MRQLLTPEPKTTHLRSVKVFCSDNVHTGFINNKLNTKHSNLDQVQHRCAYYAANLSSYLFECV